MSNVRDQLAAAAVQHGAQVVARGGLGLAARVVRTWVYVWLTPPVLALAWGLWQIVHNPSMSEPLAPAIVLPFLWFFPSMAVTAIGVVIFAAFRYK